MASTKIINVLKDDKFDEILDLFKNTPAKEVIFVLPKNSKAFKKEEHFVILESEATKLGKKISLLCSSPDTNHLAKKYKFDVLLAKSGDDQPLITAVNQFDSQDDDDEEEEADFEDTVPEEKQEDEEVDIENKEPKLEPEPELSDTMSGEDDDRQLVTLAKMQRGLEGIIRKNGKQLKVNLKKEQQVNLPVSKTKEPAYEDIKSVWKKQSDRIPISSYGESIWSGINNKTRESFRNSLQNLPKRSVFTLGMAAVVLLGTIIYLTTGSAKIDITPRKQPISAQLKVSASDKFSTVNTVFNYIPGQLFNVEKSASQNFISTGEKDVAQKARGTITVYNVYGTAPQVLIATTRFQTPDGLIFRTLKGIVVPGTTVVGGKIVPGSISVEVIADKAGKEYNIPASKFGIPAFNEKGDALRYEKIYGQSDSTMSGGALGQAKVVTDFDFNDAKQTLTDQVTKDVQDSLAAQTAGLKIVNASAINLQAPQSTAKVDEAADTFTMTINGAIKTVGFKADDLNGLIAQYIDRTQNLTVIPDKLDINYSNITLDDVSGMLTFTVNIKGDGYAKVDSDKIKSDLIGKNGAEIKDYFKTVSGVNTVKVMLSPPWVARIPKNQDKIKLNIIY